MVGAPRSGTTVVFEALARHEHLGWFSNYNARFPKYWWIDAFISLKNLPVLRKIPYGEKSQFKQGGALINALLPRPNEGYPIWEQLCGKKFLKDYLIDEQASTEERKGVIRAVRRALWLQKKKRFGIKLTGPSRITYLRSIFPDAFFVNVIRDGRAVVCSQLNVAFWKERGGYERPWWENGLERSWKAEWQKYDRSPEALAAMQWKRILEVNDQEVAALPPRSYMHLRYEDFIENPHKVTAEMLEFCDLPHSPSIGSYLQKKDGYRNMNKKYLSYFSADQIADMEDIMRPMLHKYGYLSNQ